MTYDMPASYKGDALGGSSKPDGVNQLMKKLLERGARYGDMVDQLTRSGKAKTAVRMHLRFLTKNRIVILVNGQPYQVGQTITVNDFISLASK